MDAEETKYTSKDIQLFSQIKTKILKEMKNLFKTSENAFAEMDFNGKGFIEEDNFFQTLLNYKLPYSKEEIKRFFGYEKLFIRTPDGKMNFECFKKSFFPIRSVGGKGEDNEHDDEINLDTISCDKTKSDILVNRMKKIENLLKEKFSNNWTSIRKAFLDIDMDYDGFITAEDIARQFGKDNQKLDFRDLRTLIKNRDSKRKGKIDFKDFCKWMGGAIEPSETFYFRHDSLRNPQYEENMKKQNLSNGENMKLVSDKIMNSNLMKRILDKISTQWKTLKKAFSDLNQGKNGWISEVDLKRYLVNWGFNITDEQFREFYEFLDYDKDGHITYEDFKKSVGSVISPIEFLYFRQDMPPQKLVTCKHSNCWEETKGMGKYCFLHKKIIKDKALRLVSNIQRQLSSSSWVMLVEKLKENCDKSNPGNIQIDKFFKILAEFEGSINQQQKEDLIECFHLKDEGNQMDMSIKSIFDFNKTKALSKIYKDIDLEQREDDEEMSLIQQRLLPISEEDLILIMNSGSNTHELWRMMKKQDKDSNGFLTLSELNSIFTQKYPDLEGKSLFKVLRPFTSIQNKQLVDYKKLKGYFDDRVTSGNPLKQPEHLPAGVSRNDNMRESHTFNKMSMPISPREVRSPSMKRMEQIKDEILKAAESSPLIMANRHIAQRHHSIQSPPLELKKNSTLEALVSPRSSKHRLPQLDSKNLTRSKANLMNGGNRVMSPDRISVGSKFSQYSTFSSPFFNKSNQMIKQKLEYEWRNIFRALNSIDIDSSGYVTKKEF